jgi:hypothetical protein
VIYLRAYKWSAEERDIKRDILLFREALDPRQLGKCDDPRKDGIGGDWDEKHCEIF